MFKLKKEGRYDYKFPIELLKNQKPSYPHEFIIIDYSDHAKQNGFFDESNKEIQIYKSGKIAMRRPYIYSFLKTLLISNKIPYIDLTQKKIRLRIKKKIKPEIIQYFEEE